MFADIKTVADVGTVAAKIHNNFELADFKGPVTFFFHASAMNKIYLLAKHKISDTEWYELSTVFLSDIQVKHYELPNPAFPLSLSLRKTWVDDTGETHSKNFVTDKNIGYVTVEAFDIEVGIFEAGFNFTILSGGKSHQMIGNAKVTQWSDVTK
ncbi:hypothetical protein [Pseudomonas fitomaticsae]|uniref:Uncharacterized protein n=1 Tax=Pseudomonas fitomaticsae TaxID=2837969 RepID=A0ABY3Q533_9PSED|nr:hypothetical protein [Pseudomonas fitomaticsae]UFQ01206.1 hypothetical protein KJY40_05820 [Pseudomonas fitomaticsae]